MAKKLRVRINKNGDGKYFWENLNEQGKPFANSATTFENKADCVKEAEYQSQYVETVEVVDATDDP